MYPPNLNVPLPDPSELAPQQTLQGPDKVSQAMSLIAPMLALGTALGGSPQSGAAFLGGAHVALQKREQDQQVRAHQQQQLQVQLQQQQATAAWRQQQEEQARNAATAKLVQETAAEVRGKSRPEYEQIIAEKESVASMFLMARPNAIRAAVPYMAPNADAVMAEAAGKFLKNPANAQAIADGKLDGMVMVDVQGDGKPIPVPVRDVLKAGGTQFDPESGAPFVMPKAKAGGIQLDDEAFFGEVAKFEAEKGRKATPEERGVIALRVKKQMGDAGRLPPSGGGAAAGPMVLLKPGQQGFNVAQDLAYGRMTFPMFRTIVAYSRDQGAKQAIYDTAKDLNPNFNPAGFEMGFKLASNPKVQQQLASMDNVVQAIPDLIKVSDAAKRSGATSLNKFTSPIKVAIGKRAFTNFRTAQIAFADELSGALGYGSATDMSREMGFNMTDPNLSADNFSSGLRDVVEPFIQRKRQTLLDQMGVYGEQGMNPGAKGDSGGAEVWVRDKTGKLVKKGGGNVP